MGQWVNTLTHWGRVKHICVSKLTIIGSDNGLSPRRRQAIIWTNAGILLIGPFGTKFSEISIEIVRVSFKKMRLKGSSAKWRPFCLGLNELMGHHGYDSFSLLFWIMFSFLNVGKHQYSLWKSCVFWFLVCRFCPGILFLLTIRNI